MISIPEDHPRLFLWQEFTCQFKGVGHSTKLMLVMEEIMTDQTRIQTQAPWISSQVLYQLCKGMREIITDQIKI